MNVPSNDGIACPCCGYDTLRERGAFNCCTICWWEDDGQDNEDADEVRGGPNADLSLTQARINFLNFGIAFPNRADLQPNPRSSQKQLRYFRLTDKDNVIESRI
jgi:hypothetical protein